MAHLPDGVMFLLQTKTAQQTKWQTEAEFVPDAANNYPESQVQEEANAAFQLLFADHSGGTKQYQYLKCIEFGHEIRPVPEP